MFRSLQPENASGPMQSEVTSGPMQTEVDSGPMQMEGVSGIIPEVLVDPGRGARRRGSIRDQGSSQRRAQRWRGPERRGGRRGGVERRIMDDVAPDPAVQNFRDHGVNLVDHPCDHTHPAPTSQPDWWSHHRPGHKIPHHHRFVSLGQALYSTFSNV